MPATMSTAAWVAAAIVLAAVVVWLIVRRARERARAARHERIARERADDFKLRSTPRPLARLVYGPKTFRRPRRPR